MRNAKNNISFFKKTKMQTSIICSICSSQDQMVTDPESGEIICSSCGQVIPHTILEHNTPESPAFNTEEYNNKSRTYIQKSLVMHDIGAYYHHWKI